MGPRQAYHYRLRRLARARCWPGGGACLVLGGGQQGEQGWSALSGATLDPRVPLPQRAHTISQPPSQQGSPLWRPAWSRLPSLPLSHRVRVLVGSRLSTCGENHRAGGKRTGQSTVSTWRKSRRRAQGGLGWLVCVWTWMGCTNARVEAPQDVPEVPRREGSTAVQEEGIPGGSAIVTRNRCGESARKQQRELGDFARSFLF